MNDKAAVQHGMNLAAQLPDMMPDQANERIKPVYEEIQASLRVPFVNLIFRVLANYPDYLLPAWKSLAPIVRAREFEVAADELRAAAALEDLPQTAVIDADVPELRAFNDTIHYVLPKLLLVASLLEERVPAPEQPCRQSQGRLPFAVAAGATKVEMVDPDHASGRVTVLFNSIKATHGHPLVSSYFRGLAQWPDVLEALWAELKPIVGINSYEDRKADLIHLARLHTRDLVSFQIFSPPEHDPAEVAALLAAFRFKFIPEMLIDVVLVKAMLDGPSQAPVSRFSAA